MFGLSPTLVWAILGFALLIVEIFTQSFVVVFFGVAALAVAALKAATGYANLPYEILAFAAIGTSCIFLFRQKLLKAFFSRGGIAIDRMKVIELSADVPARGTAKVEYQGTIWDAHNESDVALRRGEQAMVVDTDGIKLVVRPAGQR